MAKEFAKAFYKSKAWKKCREAYIKSVYGLCERCGKPGYIVHHKILLTYQNINDPDITLNWENLEYLCQNCHNQEHHRNCKATREGLMFDGEGNLVQSPL
ncbi:HNH endonuclease [Crassaminicella thermophila]|uniref:Putative HNH nuclease YajD n=1 Tax=Crassaminicella thermophila TaxID=2599308 RepID=A0A5C0SEJ8_CRATE|nr:HNH endonuclease [Crassaminicella thermophila]QEK12590.1 HNH endonuclease [Crassaminicella thermophila]